jgi:hypothetical protein
MYVIPKWHIETWLAYLDGADVSEESQYKQDHGFKSRESGSHTLVDKLAEACRCRQSLQRPPDSLVRTCGEFDRIRNLL